MPGFNLTDHLSRQPIGCPSNTAPWANGSYANDVQEAAANLELLESEMWQAYIALSDPDLSPAAWERGYAALQQAEDMLVNLRRSQQVARDVADVAAEIYRKTKENNNGI